MQRIVKSEAVVPRDMSEAERSALTDALFEVHSTIFGGVDRERTLATVVSPKSDYTTILLHRNAEGAIVGFFAIHFYDRDLGSQPTTIVRSIVGTLSAYRGQNVNIGWALRVLATRRLQSPGRRFFGFGLMAHPSSFSQVSRYVETFWPAPGQPVPPDILGFMLDLADEFNLPRVDATRPLVRGGAVPTQETEAERSYWRTCDKPAARFFVTMNPGYSQGTGVVTLFPITARMLAGIATRIAREKARLAAEGALASAQRLPLGAALLRPAEVRKRLRAVPLFAALPQASLERLVSEAEIVSLPATRYLFRQGDEGGDIYLVVRGAVQVIFGQDKDRDKGEGEMVDQLAAGSLLGEIAALTGGRRSASVRAAIPSTLVKMRGEGLRSLMAESPPVRDAIWGAFAERVVDDHLRVTRRFPELDRTARIAWLRRARHEELEPGDRIRSEGDALVVVLRGTALVEREGAPPATMQAPAVIEPDASTQLSVKTAARVAHVPPIEP